MYLSKVKRYKNTIHDHSYFFYIPNSGKSDLPFVIPELLEQGGSNIRNLKFNKANGENNPRLSGSCQLVKKFHTFKRLGLCPRRPKKYGLWRHKPWRNNYLFLYTQIFDTLNTP